VFLNGTLVKASQSRTGLPVYLNVVITVQMQQKNYIFTKS